MKHFIISFALWFPFCLYAQTELLKNGVDMYEEFRFQDAEPILTKASEIGVIDAFYYLGKIYEDTHYSYYDLSKTTNYFKKGADNGNVNCMTEYALILLSNKSHTDSLEAIKLLNNACKQENGKACSVLGKLEGDWSSAGEYFLKANKLGENNFYELARYYYYYKHDYFRAKEFAEKAVYYSDDNHNALSLLGESCYKNNDYINGVKYLMPFFCLSGNCSHKRKALYYLGNMYQHGCDILKKDLEKAKTFYIYSAYLGDKDAAKQLFVMANTDYDHMKILQFYGLTSNQVLDYYKKQKVNTLLQSLKNKTTSTYLSADENFAIGCCYLEGLGSFNTDTISAIQYFKKAIELGSQESLLCLGNIFKVRGEKTESIELFKKAAEAGNIEAMYELYSYNTSYVKNYKKKVKLFDSFDDYDVNSLEKQDSKDSYLLAAYKYLDAYHNNMILVGIKKQNRYYEETKRIYHSSFYYGFSYKNSKEKAAECFYRAKEYDKAFDLLRDTAEVKTGLGYAFLGLCFYHGNGIDKNHEIAMYYLRKAADLENETAMVAIGNDFRLHGDYVNAVHWYRLGAHFGSREGMKNLALCYERGLGVTPNKILAKAWMEESASLGDSDANHVIKK